jgi:hypothetical protein
VSGAFHTVDGKAEQQHMTPGCFAFNIDQKVFPSGGWLLEQNISFYPAASLT